jgi:hypothetical protein
MNSYDISAFTLIRSTVCCVTLWGTFFHLFFWGGGYCCMFLSTLLLHLYPFSIFNHTTTFSLPLYSLFLHSPSSFDVTSILCPSNEHCHFLFYLLECSYLAFHLATFFFSFSEVFRNERKGFTLSLPPIN